jgi:toxin-antitoxin system PIN domain toxin
VSRYLLDANALIALGWPAHEHHGQIQAWFRKNARHGWVTTPFTQAAFVRVVSQPAFSGKLVGPREAAELLSRNLAHSNHSFFPADMGIAEVAGLCSGGLMGHRQVTNAYLLALAIKRNCKLVTFDSDIRQLLATETERQIHIELLA